MIQIILPENQNLIADLTDAVLADVAFRLFGTREYVTKSENRRNGRYIRVENDQTGQVVFVCFSNPHNNSRNAHLMQFVSPAYIDFHTNSSSQKQLAIYLLQPSGNDRTDYIKLFYRCFLTLGIQVLNSDELGISGMAPFSTYEDLKAYRNRTSGRNSRNRSTYFTDDDERISIYGKTFGANAMESFIFGLTISRLANKPVVFIPVVDNESSDLSSEQRQALRDAGVHYGGSIVLAPSGYARPTRDTSRNTSIFHYNLLQKYGDKQCYFCGCNVEYLIIGAHIERVSDIDRSPMYTVEQKAERATDGDNGLWLCANHDKMFEYGLLYFAANTLQIGAFVVEPVQRAYIENSILSTRAVYGLENSELPFTIPYEHYTPGMRDYITKHTERVT